MVTGALTASDGPAPATRAVGGIRGVNVVLRVGLVRLSSLSRKGKRKGPGAARAGASGCGS